MFQKLRARLKKLEMLVDRLAAEERSGLRLTFDRQVVERRPWRKRRQPRRRQG